MYLPCFLPPSIYGFSRLAYEVAVRHVRFPLTQFAHGLVLGLRLLRFFQFLYDVAVPDTPSPFNPVAHVLVHRLRLRLLQFFSVFI